MKLHRIKIKNFRNFKDLDVMLGDQVVIVVPAYSSIEGVITAMRDGAFHYISKPFKNEEVVLTIRRGLGQRQLTAESRALRAQLGQRFGIDNLIGKSAAMRSVYDLVRLAAPSRSNRQIHRPPTIPRSRRSICAACSRTECRRS